MDLNLEKSRFRVQGWDSRLRTQARNSGLRTQGLNSGLRTHGWNSGLTTQDWNSGLRTQDSMETIIPADELLDGLIDSFLKIVVLLKIFNLFSTKLIQNYLCLRLVMIFGRKTG